MRKLLNKKGSAMVLVLSALIILMAVSSVVVMLSAANISMSRQYSNWSADYYWLDYAAQDQLGDLDKKVLITGENIARYYLQNSYYKYPVVYEEEGKEGFPFGTGMPAMMVTTFSGAQWLQELIYAKWADLYGAYAAIPVPTKEEEDAYNESIQDFVSDLFEVLYYAYLDGNLSILPYEDDEHGVSAETTLQNAAWFPNHDESIGTFDEFCDLVTEAPRLVINAKELTDENPKQVNVQITVIPPSFTAVQQTRYYAVKANPLYANALSVRGNITFAGSGATTVQGDVVSVNQNSAGATLGLREGNRVGIKTQSGAQVTIYGNVYSGGDVHLWGDGSSISVRPYALGYTPSRLKADYLYLAGNDYYFDFAATQSDVLYYTEGYTEGNGNPYIPYIYRDSAGGNVYCNNLAIEDSIQNGRLLVSGDLWTQDDIQNDGKIGSAIQVVGNYIGMRSDANETNKDPNGSSAVINNGYMYGSTIKLDGSYIIPGTAWYEFSGGYYQTAESATARAGEYFGIYEKSLSDMDDTPDDASKVFGVYSQGPDQYTMYERQAGSTLSSDILQDRVSRFKTAMESLAGLESGISVNGHADSYTLGIVNDDGTVVYDQYSNNLIPYKAVSGAGNILDDVFTSKTSNFGTNGFGFSELIDPAAAMDDSARGFHYYAGNATVNVNNISSGIIFCNGTLTLTGSGTFTGSIICAGNLVFNSGVSVVYDESVVLSVLGFTEEYRIAQTEGGGYLGSSIARRMFSPSGFDAHTTLGIEQVTTLSTSAGEREGDEIQRYIINSWRESRAD